MSTEERIKKALCGIEPAEGAEERMLKNIMIKSKAPALEGNTVSRRSKAIKLSILIAACLILASLAVAAITKTAWKKNDSPYKVMMIDSPEVYFVNKSVGAEIDISVPKSPVELEKIEYTTKENMTKKQFTFFDQDMEFSYRESRTSQLRDYYLDRYSYVAGGVAYSVSINDVTGKIVYFYNNTAGKNHGFISTVNPSSTESEFVSYAGAVLKKYTDFSTEGWNAEIKTEITVNDRKESLDGFVNKPDQSSETDVMYTVSFYKTIGEVKRADEVFVKMSNFGEVTEFCAESFDGKYEPFYGLDISSVDVKQYVPELSVNGLVGDPVTELRAIPIGNDLWIEATVSYKCMPDSERPDVIMSGTIVYNLKVAKIDN